MKQSAFTANSAQRRRAREGHIFRITDDDPLSSVANLFDVAMVFAVALILALLSALHMAGLFNPAEDITILRNPGKANMEIIRKRGVKLEKFRISKEQAGGEGERLGICYRLPNGEVIYVPDTE